MQRGDHDVIHRKSRALRNLFADRGCEIFANTKKIGRDDQHGFVVISHCNSVELNGIKNTLGKSCLKVTCQIDAKGRCHVHACKSCF